MRRSPSDSGSVTATTCITPVSSSRCTRWRTAASESPTAALNLVYGSRPSRWSCSMMARSMSSRCWSLARLARGPSTSTAMTS